MYNTSDHVTTTSPVTEVEELQAKLTLTRFIVWRIIVPVVCTFGIVGNTINMAVLTQKVMRTSSTNIYLSVLAAFDILYLVFGLTMGLKHYDADIVNRDSYIRYHKPFGKPIVDTCSNITIWLTLTFTVERYIGVCHPMKGKRWCTAGNARWITGCVCAAAAIITFPEFFEWKVVSVIDPLTNDTVLQSIHTDMGSATSYQWGYVYMNQAVFTFCPLLLLIIFNSLLMKAVLASASRRREMSKMAVVASERQEKQTREQTKITTMLIAVVIVFITCQTPQAISNLYTTYLIVTENSSMETRLKVIIANNIFNLLVQINSSVNFVLYSCFSNRFRRVFRKLFCPCIDNSEKSSHYFSELNANNTKSTVITNQTSHYNHRTSKVGQEFNQDRAFSDKNGMRSSSKPPHLHKTKNGYQEVEQETSCV